MTITLTTTDGETLATAASLPAALAAARRILRVRRLVHDRSDGRHILHASRSTGCASVEIVGGVA